MTTTRVVDPIPSTSRVNLGTSSVVALGAFGIGLGDLLVALAGARNQSGGSGVSTLFWSGIALLYAAPTTAVLLGRLDRRSHLSLAVLLVAGIYVVSLITTPLGLSTTDELQTLRSLQDLQSSHHLFAINPLVVAYPRFPGSQIAFVMMHQLSGLSLATSAKIVIGIGEILLAVALFALVQRVAGSTLAAYAAVVVYATNPSFVYFDSQVFYESFAIPLAIATLLLVLLGTRSVVASERRVAFMLASVVGTVVCVSHHMTSYWLVAVLLLWCLLALRRPKVRIVPWLPTLAIGTVAGLWYAFVAQKEVAHELGPVLQSAVDAIKSVITRTAAPKAPFSSTSALSALNDPVVLQIIGYISVVLAMLLIALGLREAWLARGRHSALRLRGARTVEIAVFSLIALIYPLGLLLRLTQASTETSSRTSEFAFIGVSVMAALFVSARALRRFSGAETIAVRRSPLGNKEPESKFVEEKVAGRAKLPLKHGAGKPTRGFVVASILATVILAVGGIVVGQAPYDRLPGSFLAGADFRSVGPLGEETARWAASNLAPGSKFAADPTNTRLLASIGNFTPEDGSIDGYPVNHLFLSTSLDQEDLKIIQGDKIQYIVVDQRLTRFPSASGPVFGSTKSGVKVSRSLPVPKADFAKFVSASELSRIYDDGTIQIYATNVATSNR